MKHLLGRDRRGFTLVEVFIVIAMLGILAGIVVPNLANAVFKAHAADVLGDLNVVRVAYHQFLADGGTTTTSSAFGAVPADLAPYLPGGFTFSTEVADYRWVRVASAASPWGVEMGQFEVKPKPNAQQELMKNLAEMAFDEFTIVGVTTVRYYILPMESGQE